MEQSFTWVLSCIESSSNEWQFRCCHSLIDLFYLKYNGEHEAGEFSTALKTKLYDQKIKHGLEV